MGVSIKAGYGMTLLLENDGMDFYIFNDRLLLKLLLILFKYMFFINLYDFLSNNQ